MNDPKNATPDAPSTGSELDSDVLTDEEITTISAGTDFNEAKNANNGEGHI